jgi:imidazolonepropionase-like amidohydrolase
MLVMKTYDFGSRLLEKLRQHSTLETPPNFTAGNSMPNMVTRPSKSDAFTIHTDLLFDPKQKAWLKNTSITVSPSTGLITKVYQRGKDEFPPDATVKEPDIDLRGKCVLPGLVDAHTHILLHAYSETPSMNQMRDESLVERVIRATNHCRAALLAGFTTYRDLGTEGAFDADVHIRDAVSRGIIPGPRIFCVSEALASSRGYETRIENRIGGVEVPGISDPCDGPIGTRAAVRRRLGAGADIIKFYADYRKRALRYPTPSWPGCLDIQFPPESGNSQGARNPNLLLFQQDEMDAIVAEAKSSRAPVAAHASSAEAVLMAAKAGVTTIEHGFESMKGTKAMETMQENGVIFVPTLAVCELYMDMKPVLAQVKEAYEWGIKLACGGDTGAFAHGESARELELMLEAGIPLEEVLVAATLHGWEACGGEWCGRKFGWVEEGVAADFVALDGDLREEVGALRRVGFVMKDARVWKREEMAVGMV